jgi:hypothetical protein
MFFIAQKVAPKKYFVKFNIEHNFLSGKMYQSLSYLHIFFIELPKDKGSSLTGENAANLGPML